MLQTLVRETDKDASTTVGVAGVGTSESPVQVTTMPIWQMVAVRVARVYLQCVVGFLGAQGTGMIDLNTQGQTLGAVQGALYLALAPAVITLIHNSVEFLARIDVKNPTFRA